MMIGCLAVGREECLRLGRRVRSHWRHRQRGEVPGPHLRDAKEGDAARRRLQELERNNQQRRAGCFQLGSHRILPVISCNDFSYSTEDKTAQLVKRLRKLSDEVGEERIGEGNREEARKGEDWQVSDCRETGHQSSS
eukprot:767048-Hanusia_phi.AAC.1